MFWAILSAIVGIAAGGTAHSAAAAGARFTLRRECPGSWELSAAGTCELRSLYQLYTSPSGFGGLRVPLPPIRGDFRPKEIDLGRLLFFDPVLSADHTLSCAHCHHPDWGFADGLGRGIGRGGHGVGPGRAGGEPLARGAPSLWNVGFLRQLFWDGRATSLEQQAEGPLFSANEMASTRPGVEATLSAIPAYVALFAEAFERPDLQTISADMVLRALAAFETSLVSLNSRYDRYAHGDEGALTAQEQRGHNLFRSFTVRCSQCHTPPLFTNGELAVIGTPEPAGRPFDAGAGALVDAPELRGAFRIPSLRNIARTAPYMHSGRYAGLADVVSFYNDKRGHAVPAEEHLLIHWQIALKGRTLDDGEVADLVAFLGALTDESLMPAVPERVPSQLPVVQRRWPRASQL